MTQQDRTCLYRAGTALEGNLEISVTTVVPWFRNVRVKHFPTNRQVKSAILASACIVPPPLHLPGHGYAIDGAFSDFQILKVRHGLRILPHLPQCKYQPLSYPSVLSHSAVCLYRLSFLAGTS